MKKILITHNDIQFVGYLIKDQKTKFVAKREQSFDLSLPESFLFL